MMSSTIKTYIMLEFFESLNDTRDFLFWNSKQGTGEWLLLRKLFGTFFTSKWLSPEWVLGRFWECLIQKMTWNILYKGGEGEFFWKWLLPKNGFSPENGFSPKMASPQKGFSPKNGFSPENKNGFSPENGFPGNNFSLGNSE